MKMVFLLFTILNLLFTIPVVAQTTPTPALRGEPATGKKPTVVSPSVTSTPSEDRVNEIKQRVLERIQEVKKNAQKRGFWGTLKEINNTTLVLSTVEGANRLIKTDKETKFILDQKDIKITDLALGNFLIVMGYLDNNDSLNAKRIAALTKPPKTATPREVMFGKVTDISPEEKVFVISPLKKETSTSGIKVTDKTTILKKVDDKMKKTEFSAIAIGDQVIVVSTKEKNNSILSAKLVVIAPGPTKATTSPTPTPAE